jgi:hypothetical protein
VESREKENDGVPFVPRLTEFFVSFDCLVFKNPPRGLSLKADTVPFARRHFFVFFS